MNDLIIILILAALAGIALCSCLRRKHTGCGGRCSGCSGACSGSCRGCDCCNHDDADDDDEAEPPKTQH